MWSGPRNLSAHECHDRPALDDTDCPAAPAPLVHSPAGQKSRSQRDNNPAPAMRCDLSILLLVTETRRLSACAVDARQNGRSEERREGTEGVSTCRSQGSPNH